MQDAYLTETQQSLRLIRPGHQQRQRQGGELLCRSEIWMAVLRQPRGKSVGSVFIFNIAVASLTMANELEFMVCVLHHLRNGSDFGFLRIPETRWGVQTEHSLTRHICAVQSDHSAETHTKCVWLKTKRDLHASFVIWCATCLIHGCSPTRFLP